MCFIKNLKILPQNNLYSLKRIIIILISLCSYGLIDIILAQQIPVIASHAIRAEFNTVENYKNIEKCGFTLACEYYPSREYAIRHLDTAGKTNVKLIVWCPEILNDMENTVREFNKYKSFGGYLLFDEPGSDKFTFVSEEIHKLRKFDSNNFIWINLFPIYASAEQLMSVSYEQYVDDYIEKVKPSFLSFDNYGIKNNGLRRDYYQNLEIISSICKKRNFPFWAYVLTSQYGSYGTPTKGTISFQTYNNLAYGAQGIEYFSYRRILEYGLNMKCAPVDTNYQIMPVYYDVKELNSEIKYYSKYFYGCDIKEVTHLSKDIPVGTRQTKTLPFGIKNCKYSGKGFVVSHFMNGKHEYVLFVNKDYENHQILELETSNMIKRISYYTRERDKGRGKQRFSAQPGSIILLRLN